MIGMKRPWRHNHQGSCFISTKESRWSGWNYQTFSLLSPPNQHQRIPMIGMKLALETICFSATISTKESRWSGWNAVHWACPASRARSAPKNPDDRDETMRTTPCFFSRRISTKESRWSGWNVSPDAPTGGSPYQHQRIPMIGMKLQA